jgi:hypothetical protein
VQSRPQHKGITHKNISLIYKIYARHYPNGVPVLLTLSSTLALTLPHSRPAPSLRPSATLLAPAPIFTLAPASSCVLYRPLPAFPPTDSSYPPALRFRPGVPGAGAGVDDVEFDKEVEVPPTDDGGLYMSVGKCSAADSTMARKLAGQLCRGINELTSRNYVLYCRPVICAYRLDHLPYHWTVSD